MQLVNWEGAQSTGSGFVAAWAAAFPALRVPLDTWFHVAVTMSLDGLSYLYIDGTEVLSLQLQAWDPSVWSPFDSSIKAGTAIGRRAVSWEDKSFVFGAEPDDNQFRQYDDQGYVFGDLDELRVWKRCLSAQELVDALKLNASCESLKMDEMLASCFSFDVCVGLFLANATLHHDAGRRKIRP